jgi:hypothetical protein
MNTALISVTRFVVDPDHSQTHTSEMSKHAPLVLLICLLILRIRVAAFLNFGKPPITGGFEHPGVRHL